MLRVFGDWNESYQALPKWMNILKLTNPRANIVWKTIPFRRDFWERAFHACLLDI